MNNRLSVKMREGRGINWRRYVTTQVDTKELHKFIGIGIGVTILTGVISFDWRLATSKASGSGPCRHATRNDTSVTGRGASTPQVSLWRCSTLQLEAGGPSYRIRALGRCMSEAAASGRLASDFRA